MKKLAEFSFLKHTNTSEPVSYLNGFDTRIIRTRIGHFYLCLLQPLETKCENHACKYISEQESRDAGVISLDSGESIFFTSYSPSGMIVECGNGDMNRSIGKICE
jgi:hypothetical protein